MTLETFLLADIAMLIGATGLLTVSIEDFKGGGQSLSMPFLGLLAIALLVVGTLPAAAIVLREVITYLISLMH